MAAKGRSYWRQVKATLAEIKREVEASRGSNPVDRAQAMAPPARGRRLTDHRRKAYHG